MDTPTTWSPAQYERFKRERTKPFLDLLRLVRPREGMAVVDLGCGTGAMTEVLAGRLPEASVLGVDASEAMLEAAHPRSCRRIRFEKADIADLDALDLRRFDLVFSNAALHWVPDHPRYFPALLDRLKPGAQLAVQMPRNDDHPSHRLARAVAADAPFDARLRGFVRESPVRPLEAYAAWLHAAGMRRPTLLERLYVHPLDGVDAVVDWVKGSLLVPYLERLEAAEDRDAFLAAYRARLAAVLGEGPLAYTYRRLFIAATKGS
jgi:trans-aconitate 2-methyltransferase